MAAEIDTLIEVIEKDLVRVGGKNVLFYTDKLRTNSKNVDRLEDLLFEGRIAFLLLSHEFKVEMRESPDLAVVWENNEFFVEVKHFRTKVQDRVDQQRMDEADDLLVSYGNTVPLEKFAPWDQVAMVAEQKVKQYIASAPNILAIGSSSYHCIDDAIMPTAINIIEGKIDSGECRALEKLNGILLLSSDYNISQKRRVYFFLNRKARVPLPTNIMSALDQIRDFS